MVAFPGALRAGEGSILRLCVDYFEITGKSGIFEMDIVAIILDYKWNSIGRPVYKFKIFLSFILAVTFTFSSIYIDDMFLSDQYKQRTWAYVWQAVLVILVFFFTVQGAIQLKRQGTYLQRYIHIDIWNME